MADNLNLVSVANTQQSVSQQTASAAATQKPESKPPIRNEAAIAGKAAAEFVEITSSQLDGLVEQLNNFMKEGQRSLSFAVDRNANEVVVSVLDRETKELIRQIPSPEALKLKEHLDGVIGLLFSDQA